MKVVNLLHVHLCEKKATRRPRQISSLWFVSSPVVFAVLSYIVHLWMGTDVELLEKCKYFTVDCVWARAWANVRECVCVIACILVHRTALYYWAHNLHIVLCVLLGNELSRRAISTCVRVWKGIFTFVWMVDDSDQYLNDCRKCQEDAFSSETVPHERFCERAKSVLGLCFLVAVPPLYGPGFHFIVLEDIWFHQFGC